MDNTVTAELIWAEATPQQIDRLIADTRWRLAGAQDNLHRAVRNAARNDGRDRACCYEFVSCYVPAVGRTKGYHVEGFLDLDLADNVVVAFGSPIVDGVNVREARRDRQAVLDLIERIGTTDYDRVVEDIRMDFPSVEAAAIEVEALQAILDEAHAEYVNRGGWNRYWLVTSSQGHIHSSTTCSTCNKRGRATGFALVFDLSGAEIEEAVEMFGAALCSVCFPEAPVEWTDSIKITPARAKAYAEGGIEAYRALVAKTTTTTTNTNA